MNIQVRSTPIGKPILKSHDMSSSQTIMEMFRFTHKWKINEFSTHQELCVPTEFIESIAFPIADNNSYQFRLKLFPNGKDEECTGFLSLFLLIQRCPGARLRFRVNFYIETKEGPRGCALNRNIVTINMGGIVTASKLFSTETLKQRASLFVPGNVLTVGVDLTVFGDHPSIPVPMTPSTLTAEDYQVQLDTLFSSEAPKKNTLRHDFADMYEHMTAHDLNLRIGSSVLQCHRAVVMARSPYFDRMFGNRVYKEAEKHNIELKEVNEIGMRAALDYMYTDKVDDIASCAQDVLIVADMLLLDGLKAKCEQALILTQRISGSVEEACNLLVVGDTYDALTLKSHCMQVLNDNYITVMASKFWIETQVAHPVLAAETLRELMVRRSGADTPFVPIGKLSTSVTDDEPSAKRAR